MAKKSVKTSNQKRLICNHCKKPISRKITYVLLGTYNHPTKNTEEAYFHFPCFVEWHEAKVTEKATGIVGQQGVLNVTSLINNPQLKELAEKVMNDFAGALEDDEKPKPKKKNDVKGKKRATTKKSTPKVR